MEDTDRARSSTGLGAVTRRSVLMWTSVTTPASDATPGGRDHANKLPIDHPRHPRHRRDIAEATSVSLFLLVTVSPSLEQGAAFLKPPHDRFVVRDIIVKDLTHCFQSQGYTIINDLCGGWPGIRQACCAAVLSCSRICKKQRTCNQWCRLFKYKTSCHPQEATYTVVPRGCDCKDVGPMELLRNVGDFYRRGTVRVGSAGARDRVYL